MLLEGKNAIVMDLESDALQALHRCGAGPAAAPRRSGGHGGLHRLRPRRSDDPSGVNLTCGAIVD
jgi:hypothetical protein